MWDTFPEIFEPDFAYVLVTSTDMYVGSGPFGGEALLPGLVVQVVPQANVAVLTAKPLKLEADEPDEVGLSLDHCAPQKVTELPFALAWSPRTNDPPPGAKPGSNKFKTPFT